MSKPTQLSLVIDDSKKATACPDCGKVMQYASIRRHRLEACKATDAKFKFDNHDAIKANPLFVPTDLNSMAATVIGKVIYTENQVDEWNALQKFDEFTRNIARPETYRLIGEMRELLMKVCTILQDTGRQ